MEFLENLAERSLLMDKQQQALYRGRDNHYYVCAERLHEATIQTGCSVVKYSNEKGRSHKRPPLMDGGRLKTLGSGAKFGQQAL